MSDRVVSLYAIDNMLSKLSGMYHIEDIRAMISKVPAAEVEDKESKWISIDRLPPKNERVLFLCNIYDGTPEPFKRICPGARSGGAVPTYWIEDGGKLRKMDRDFLGAILYWMPLPELPGEEGKK